MDTELHNRFEEAAENYADDIATTEERGWMDRSDIYAIAKDAHLAGATEQKAIDEDHFRKVTKMLIDKACEWLEEQLYTDDGGCLASEWYQQLDDFLAAFREAID